MHVCGIKPASDFPPPSNHKLRVCFVASRRFYAIFMPLVSLYILQHVHVM